MEDLNDLYYFARVVEHGGFAPAGRALGIPKSTLSRRIAALEEQLGVRLIQRSTRRFSVTEIGQIYYGHCRAVLIEAEAARESIDLTRQQPRGTIRLSCPTMLLDFRVAAMVAAFMDQCPDVQIHLEATNRRVDVIAEGLDLAIRVRPPPLEDSDLVLRVLARRSQCLVASPDLLARHGPPQKPDDLVGLPSVALGTPRAEYRWRLIGPDGEPVEMAHLPLMIVSGSLDDGRLVQVLPGWAPRPEIVHVVFPSRRGQLPAVRQFIDHLATSFAAIDEA